MNTILVAIDGKQEGPFDVNELNKKILDSKIDSSDIAWSTGMKEWLPLSDSIFLEMGIKFPDEINVQDNILSEKENIGEAAVQLPPITVVSDDQKFSGLSIREVNEKLQDNIFQQEDLAWFKGLKDWLPLSSTEFEAIGVNLSVGKIGTKPTGIPKVEKFINPTEISSGDDQINAGNTSSVNELLKIYKQNWLFYSLGVILSGIPILGFIFLFNYINLIIKHLKTNAELSLGDIFSFDNWGGKILFGCGFTICLSISFSLLLIPGIIFFTYFIYSIHIFSENEISIKKALNRSFDIVRGGFIRNAILNIIIFIIITFPLMIPYFVSIFVQIPFLNILLIPVPFLNLLTLPLVHIYLCKRYISINNQNIQSGVSLSKNEENPTRKDGRFSDKLSKVLTEIDNLGPLLKECGFILGNIEIVWKLPPSVSFSIEQKIQGENSLNKVLNNEEMTKVQRKILQAIQRVYSVDEVVKRHNMTIGMIEVSLGIPPAITTHLYPIESRSITSSL